jgi:hypothetical protein
MKLLRILMLSRHSVKYLTKNDPECKKNVEELRQAREECFSVAMQCSNKLKSTFAKVSAFSTDQNFICGDLEGVIKWIEGEVKAFDETAEDIFAPVLVPEGPRQYLKKLAVSTLRL